ncbi:patatin [Marivivens niveibacter]|uniref:Patatin n=1 Tax=Marivivens niveibacter TaxID=1930667 RepID=A0A251X2J9_9RHOB|nr:patatin-like phospholipase family protein [Marivivens niveibacter]OUD10832.1 patatin [Marivivens niveibacter]
MTFRINLALQGGGAHGAYTWGALDRLLDEEDVEVAAISGTSAGALNGAAFKAGLVNGGREGARENLNWVWRRVGAITDPTVNKWMEPFAPATELYANALTYSPVYMWWETAIRMMSPYNFGPAISNPLERIIKEFEWDAICADDGPELHVCATNVRTGKIRVFKDEEVTTQAILASACLPTLFEAVEIHDQATGKTEAYWDGGYTGNPALFPLFPQHLPDDIVIVNINPLYREEIPTDGQSIQNRINEISFNTSLLRELRAISFVKRLIADGSIKKGAMKDVNVHLVEDEALMTELGLATKMIALPVVLSRLKEAGRNSMDRFLKNHKKDLGKRGSVDLHEMFD